VIEISEKILDLKPHDRAAVRADATISLEWFVNAGQTQPSTAPHIDGLTTTFCTYDYSFRSSS
jgi:hypothetical protein